MFYILPFSNCTMMMPTKVKSRAVPCYSGCVPQDNVNWNKLFYCIFLSHSCVHCHVLHTDKYINQPKNDFVFCYWHMWRLCQRKKSTCWLRAHSISSFRSWSMGQMENAEIVKDSNLKCTLLTNVADKVACHLSFIITCLVVTERAMFLVYWFTRTPWKASWTTCWLGDLNLNYFPWLNRTKVLNGTSTYIIPRWNLVT